MAVTKLQYLDKNGVQKLAEEILKGVNTKIGDIISTTLTSPGDDTHVPSTKALLEKLGESGTASSDTAFGQIQQLKDTIGTKEDTKDKETVYGALAKAQEDMVNAMAEAGHLKYQLLEEGEVSATNPETRNNNVLYLQHDSADDKSYEIWIWNGPDKSTGEYYDGDTHMDGGETNVAASWLCVGDTSLDLAGYWKKDDAAVTALQAEMLARIEDAEIEEAVKAAYTAAGSTKLEVS